jgi:hypothetical protein
MTESLINLIEDNFVKYMYEKRLEDVARLADIWHQDEDKAKEFEQALDMLVSTHLSLRLRFQVLLPADVPEGVHTGPVGVHVLDLGEAGDVACFNRAARNVAHLPAKAATRRFTRMLRARLRTRLCPYSRRRCHKKIRKGPGENAGAFSSGFVGSAQPHASRIGL